MTLFSKALVYLSARSRREQVFRAYRVWILSGQQTDAVTFITNMTGIPSHRVREVLVGKSK